MSEKICNRSSPYTYHRSGVNINAGNALVEAIKPLAARTARPGSDAGLGGFGGVFDLKPAGFKDPVLVAANDGVGTKLRIAIATGCHETIGIDLVAMCVNDLVVQGAEPLFFLDYFAASRLEIPVAKTVIDGIAQGCRQAGAALIGGETAEMPGLYANGDYDLAGFAVGAAERGALLPRPDVKPGDIILGLASSGPHSNGYSLIRRLMTDHGLDYTMPAPFAPDCSFGEALLKPTKIYARTILAVLRGKHGRAIKAMAHITGGGIIENVPRALPGHLCAVIDLDTMAPQPIFAWFAGIGRIEEREMLRTFNCGIGMAVVVGEDHADPIAREFAAAGSQVRRLGAIEKRKDAGIVMRGSLKWKTARP